jgi:hypothetical protein
VNRLVGKRKEDNLQMCQFANEKREDVNGLVENSAENNIYQISPERATSNSVGQRPTMK